MPPWQIMASSNKYRSPIFIGVLLAALVVLTLISVFSVRQHTDKTTPAPEEAGQVTEKAAGLEVSLTPTQRQAGLMASDGARITFALRGVSRRALPFTSELDIDGRLQATLVLVARDEPYDLIGLAQEHPEAITVTSPGTVSILRSVLIAPGATLNVDSTTVQLITLESTPEYYTSINAIDATLNLKGRPDAQLVITSHDSTTGSFDGDMADGRAYIHAASSTLTLDNVLVSRLGFAQGDKSGVSWMARDGIPSTGGAIDSTFSENYFGAYSSGAQHLQIVRSTFIRNSVYGFDPHTGTNYTLVLDSTASENGKHGFIFSSDCHNNVVRNSVAYNNGGSGFVIDDGADEKSAALGKSSPSNNNLLDSVTATNNGRAGVIVEGGSHNLIQAARITDNAYGVWVKNEAFDTSIVDSEISGSKWAGIRLNHDTTNTSIMNTRITKSGTGMVVEGPGVVNVSKVSIDNSQDSAVILFDTPSGATFVDVSISGTGKSPVVALNEGQPVPDLPAGIDVSYWQAASSSNQAVDTQLKFLIKAAPWLTLVCVPLLIFLINRVRRHHRPVPRLQSEGQPPHD